MGRRSTAGFTRAEMRVRALALHPTDGTACPCGLGFTPRGLVLETIDEPGALGSGSTQVRVPWWAVHGFSVDDTVSTPNGEGLRALDLITDAGTLRLAVRAEDVAVSLSLLARHAARWRRWRSPAPRWLGGRLAIVQAGAAEAARRATRVDAVAWLRRALRELKVRPVVGAAVAAVIAVCAVAAAAITWGRHPAEPQSAGAALTSIHAGVGVSGIAGFLANAHLGGGTAKRLVRAAAPPPPAPPSIADAPALSPHEVFGFVPYWMLGDASAFDVSAYTTLAYFAVPVNSNGTLDESGTGWDGYESQAFADLVGRAHAAGDRVVLTVNCFSLPGLAALTSSHAAASVLASSVVAAVAAKHLDGVNLDFEGGGPAERVGLTALVTTVATAVHAANPHFQVTVDTNGYSAGDPQGFYDVKALASVTDGLFVMAYGLNYGATESAASPIVSGEMSAVTEATEYAAAVPAQKVIFGTSYFGYSWATTNGTMGATATATGTPVTYAQVVASGHPIYWDPVTDTSWTSYESKGQWYEDYVNDPASVYLVARLAQQEGFAGVGVWALGMDGNDPQMTAALDGNAPAQRAGPAGPIWTAPSKKAPKAPPKSPPKPGTPGGGAAQANPPPASGAPTTTTTTTSPTNGTGTSPGTPGTQATTPGAAPPPGSATTTPTATTTTTAPPKTSGASPGASAAVVAPAAGTTQPG
jgi:hypothetical protein